MEIFKKIENRLFSHIIYSDNGFPPLYSSQFFPTSSPIQIPPRFCVSENKLASKGY